jgi:hypothetical protein
MRENMHRSWFVSHPELATPKEWGKSEQLERRAREVPLLIFDDLGLGSRARVRITQAWRGSSMSGTPKNFRPSSRRT